MLKDNLDHFELKFKNLHQILEFGANLMFGSDMNKSQNNVFLCKYGIKFFIMLLRLACSKQKQKKSKPEKHWNHKVTCEI